MTAPARPGGQRSSTASGLALVGAVTTTVANFGMAWLVSTEGAAAAGVFFVATAITTILANTASLGSMTGVVYAMPSAERAGGARRVLTIALPPVLVVAAVATAGVVALAGPLARAVTDGDTAVDDLVTMLRVMAVAVGPFALNLLFAAVTRALGSQTPTVVTTQVLRPGGQIVLLGALFASSDEPSAALIAAAWAAPVVVAAVVCAVWAATFGAFERRPIDDPDALDARSFWAYTRPRAISTALQIALERIDVVLVSAFVGGGAAGVYGALSRFVTAGSFLIYSVAQAVSPRLRQAIAGERWGDAGALLRQATTWLVLVVWPYFLLLAVRPAPLARLLSDDYVDDAGILAVLAVGMLASAAAGPIELTLLMLGRSDRALWGIVAAIVTDLGLLVVLAPRFELWGAAVAWAASIVVQNALATWFVVAETRPGGPAGAPEALRAQSRPAALAAVGAVVATVPIGLVVADTLAGVVLAGVVAGAILVAWVWRFRDDFGVAALLRR